MAENYAHHWTREWLILSRPAQPSPAQSLLNREPARSIDIPELWLAGWRGIIGCASLTNSPCDAEPAVWASAALSQARSIGYQGGAF